MKFVILSVTLWLHYRRPHADGNIVTCTAISNPVSVLMKIIGEACLKTDHPQTKLEYFQTPRNIGCDKQPLLGSRTHAGGALLNLDHIQNENAP